MSTTFGALPSGFRKAADNLASRSARVLQDLLLAAEASAKTASRPRRRTGTLARSIRSRVSIQGDVVTGTLEASGPGARTQEGPADGGAYTLIRAVRAKHLAIPVGEALTGAGAPRYSSPREVPGLYFLPSGTGEGGVLALQRGRSRSPSDPVLFVLKKQVRVPATRFLSTPFNAAAEKAKTDLAGLARDVVLEGLR